MSHQGFYSCIQICPDVFINDRLTIGILLCSPELNLIKAEPYGNPFRISEYFGIPVNLIYSLMNGTIEYINRFIKTKEELEKYISTRANNIKLTELRSVRIDNDFDITLNRLLKYV